MKNNCGVRSAVLAFDTSAYTTSVSVVEEEGGIIADERKLLEVKKGDRGLRQSQAFFQHMGNLPSLTETACQKAHQAGVTIRAVSVSSRPRPEEGSYMPVFMAGMHTGECIASAMQVPLYTFSHQEGHMAAAAGVLEEGKRSLAFHLSGGTSELLLLDGCRPVKIAGGSKDLSFGQLIDRTGVAYGCSFPAGKVMDAAALAGIGALSYHFSSRGKRVYEEPVLSRISIDGTECNLSGIETSCMKAAAQQIPLEKVAPELFLRMMDALISCIEAAGRQEELSGIILAGGVASSRFFREYLKPELERRNYKVIFGAPELSSDNAVGTARLGMHHLLG